MNYKATIIIPCYNKSHCVARALDSLVKLSRFEDFEIFVIDDCSTDDSYDIIMKYDKKYKNITGLRLEKGSGSPSKPRNTGMAMATTDYFIFMDPDDITINDGYSLLLTKMEEYQCDILIGTRTGVDSNNGTRVFLDFIDPRFKGLNQNNDVIKKVISSQKPYILKTIYSRKLIEDHNIRFCEELRTSEDAVFDMTCLAYAKTVGKLDDIIYQYTSGSQGSITTGVDLRMYRDMSAVLRETHRAYTLLFSESIVAERIMTLIKTFYLQRLSYMDSLNEILTACNYIHDAFEKLGYDKFTCLKRNDYIRLVEDIKNENYRDIIGESLLKRIHVLNKKLNKSDKKLKKCNHDLKEAKKLMQRKIVKPAIKLATSISSMKGNGQKGIAETSAAKEKRLIREKYEKQFFDFVNNICDSPNGVWVFMDREDNAKDNGEALYRYVMQNSVHDKLAFILRNDSIDYERLKAEGFNVVDFGSLEHWQILKNCEYFFTSHCDGFLTDPWYYTGPRSLQKKLKNQNPVNRLYKLVFLQHGVIRSDLSSWLGKIKIDKFVTSARQEKQSLLDIPQYCLSENNILFTGLPRWDLLHDCREKIITVFPTWRHEIFFGEETKIADRFYKSEFYKSWKSLLELLSAREDLSEFKIKFVMHHDNDILLPYIKEIVPDNIELIPYSSITSWSEIVNTSAFLITDYSSLSFDFLYLSKPVIYYDFERNAFFNNVAGMEYSNFGYYCPELEKVQKALDELKENNYMINDRFEEYIRESFVNRNGQHAKSIIDNL